MDQGPLNNCPLPEGQVTAIPLQFYGLCLNEYA